MGLFDSIMGKVSGHADVENLATKLGISPELAQQAIAALARAHQGGGDPVPAAAAETGLEPAIVQQIVDQIGGVGSLTEFAGLTG